MLESAKVGQALRSALPSRVAPPAARRHITPPEPHAHVHRRCARPAQVWRPRRPLVCERAHWHRDPGSTTSSRRPRSEHQQVASRSPLLACACPPSRACQALCSLVCLGTGQLTRACALHRRLCCGLGDGGFGASPAPAPAPAPLSRLGDGGFGDGGFGASPAPALLRARPDHELTYFCMLSGIVSGEGRWSCKGDLDATVFGRRAAAWAADIPQVSWAAGAAALAPSPCPRARACTACALPLAAAPNCSCSAPGISSELRGSGAGSSVAAGSATTTAPDVPSRRSGSSPIGRANAPAACGCAVRHMHAGGAAAVCRWTGQQ